MGTAIGIDGRYGEGGGQILRTSLALAAILRRPVKIHHIRGGRKRAGLRPQHLMAVKAMASITGAQVKGAEIGSTDLLFVPREIKPADYSFDVGTAGSTSLVLQGMLPALFLCGSGSRIVITGGTHVPWSPCFHYLREVFVPSIQAMGGSVSLEIERWGWYPKGGGKVIASISPLSHFRPIERLSRGKVRDVFGLSAVSNLPEDICKRQRDQVLKRLRDHGIQIARMDVMNAPSPGTGTLVFLRLRFENAIAGFTALGKRGKRAERVADEACAELFGFTASGAAVDLHLADQLVLYMALAQGQSSILVDRITAHLRTNVWVIERFLPVKFEVDEVSGRVSVRGTGLSPR